MTQPFSVLLPVYSRDRADFLARSLRSVIEEQTRLPDELVVVQDGPLGPDVSGVLDDVCVASTIPVVRLALQRNVGLAEALAAGLEVASHDIVARQDADDISLPHRFATQVPMVEAGVDLAGSAILEIGDHENDVVGLRSPPTDPHRIASYARFHDPFNHPSVVYRRAAVRAVGGYQTLPLLEDYWLFARMILGGAVVANVDEPLVLYRVGAGSYARRGGLELLRSEMRLQARMHRAGFTSSMQYARNLLVRGGYRLVPEPVRRRAYRRMLPHWTDARTAPAQPGHSNVT